MRIHFFTAPFSFVIFRQERKKRKKTGRKTAKAGRLPAFYTPSFLFSVRYASV